MKKLFFTKIIGACVIISFLAGCAQVPGERKTQGAVIGGAAGAAAGAAVAKNNRALGAVIGGVLGAGGGYVIAGKTDKANDHEGATKAMRKSQENPATAEDARKAMSADLNMDGFVTLDEVVALKQAGYDDGKILERLRATDQVFELNTEQQKYLRDRGVSAAVVSEMSRMNRQAEVKSQNGGEVIGRSK